MSNLSHRTVLTREKRSGAIAAYSGSPEQLAKESQETGLVQRVRTFTQDAPSDLHRALSVLRTIQGLAIVVHGPAGCAASLNGGFEGTAPWAVTGINERDSIMGGDRKLRAAILQVHQTHHPAAIAVVSTPVVAINNDDIDSVVTELNEELGLPIIPVLTDGFRSKVSGSGYDAAIHALLREYLWQPESVKGHHLNLLAVAEQAEDIATLRTLLEELDQKVLVFPRHGEVSRFEGITQARLSVSIDPEEGYYAGTSLQEKRGIPFAAPPLPLGIRATTHWVREIGAALGLPSQAEALVLRHETALEGLKERLAPHRGARLFLNLPASQAFSLIPFLEELGLQIVGLGVAAITQHQDAELLALAETHRSLPFLVGESQVFEEVNLLGKVQPDLYLGSGSAAVHALRLGIPVLDLHHLPVLGYAGAERLVDALVRTLDHPSFAKFLAEPQERRYAKAWLSKSTHWYIKHEVK